MRERLATAEELDCIFVDVMSFKVDAMGRMKWSATETITMRESIARGGSPMVFDASPMTLHTVLNMPGAQE